MKRLLYALGFFALACTIGSCDNKDDLKLQAISVDFAVSEIGMDGNSTEVGLKLSRATEQALDVILQMSSTEVSPSDIVVTPAMDNEQLVVSIPAGSSTASFTVTKASGKYPEGSVKFQILSLSQTEGYKIGTTQSMTLSFSPIVSSGSKMTLEGHADGENYGNMVYVDLSNNTQTQIKRKSWNLGFYCGDEFRVIVNSSYSTVAVASGKTDFASVTLQDAQAAPNLAAGTMSEDFSSDWIDDVEGDLTKTAFGEIAANSADNKVFFVASQDNKANADGSENRSLWYKVKVSRNGDGYRVEYGTVEETTPRVVEIEKNPLYNFIGLSLATGEQTPAQPEAKKWDIMWAYAASSTEMGTGLVVISITQDVVATNNVSNVETALVMTSSKSYADFKAADIPSVTFQTKANVIGTGWRTPAMPGVSNAGVKSDRFYVIKDCAGNYYKLQFLKFGSGDTGERGRPELQYELLQ